MNLNVREHTRLTKWTRPLRALAMASALSLGTLPALAQESTPTAGNQMDLSSAPVDMHEGTCASPTLDPWTTVGRLQRMNFGDVAGMGDGALDDGALDDAALEVDAGLTEDLDNDGVLDEGEDLNDNGVLDAGVDANGDGILTEDEIVAEGEAIVAVINLPTVYSTEGEIDANYDALFGQENVIAIHQSSEQYETIVACGNLGGVPYGDEGGEIVVGLSSVDGSGVRGYAVFDYDPSIFGNEFTRVTVLATENVMTQRDAMAAATPEA